LVFDNRAGVKNGVSGTWKYAERVQGGMKHFADTEFLRFDLLRPQMKEMLDDLREMLGPILITSSYRDPAHNLAVGGVSNSSHIPNDADGLYSGIDFTLPGGLITPRALSEFIGIARDMGFRRIGLYKDMRHIHIDIETTLDQDVIWIS
jgi:uncharacterized protein YcbK (DUF882 family)